MVVAVVVAAGVLVVTGVWWREPLVAAWPQRLPQRLRLPLPLPPLGTETVRRSAAARLELTIWLGWTPGGTPRHPWRHPARCCRWPSRSPTAAPAPVAAPAQQADGGTSWRAGGPGVNWSLRGRADYSITGDINRDLEPDNQEKLLTNALAAGLILDAETKRSLISTELGVRASYFLGEDPELDGDTRLDPRCHVDSSIFPEAGLGGGSRIPASF